MTTKELVQWVLDAEAELENSWNDDTKSYSHTQENAICKTKPATKIPTQAENDMALTLICNNWNECQVWIKDL